MGAHDLSEKFMEIYQTLNFGELEALFADNFISHGTHMPAPMPQEQFIGFLKILTDGCSDLDFHPRVTEIGGSSFRMAWQLTGTHTGVLKLSSIGLSDFEPTNRSFSLPEDLYTVTVNRDKIVKVFIDPVDGGGIDGIINQLGLA